MRALIAAAVTVLLSGQVMADGGRFPSAPITMLVPYAPGGSGDILARLLGAELQHRLSKPVIVENRPGGSEIIATEVLSRSNPDGYTLGVLSNALSINEVAAPSKNYNISRDLVPVAKVINIPFVLLTNPKLKVRSVAELIALAKAQPGVLNYAHLGVGSPHYIIMEWFKRVAGIDIVAVPYKSSALSYAALLSNEVQVMDSGLGPTLPYLESGQATALASMSPKRAPALPDVPSISELGYPQFDLLSWMGVFAPAGTPNNRVKLLSDEIIKIVESDKMKNALMKLGLEPAPLAQSEFESFLKKDVSSWSSVARSIVEK